MLTTAHNLLLDYLNSAPTVAQFPKPADLLNQLTARRKKSGRTGQI
ncbi:hypothetical protein QUA83_03935 [Microcoleus sp. K1-B1]